MEMMLRLVVALFFGASTVILAYAYWKQRHVPHLLGIAIWCFHVLTFTMIAALRAAGFLSIDPHLLNVWSNIIRLHGGIMVFSTALYYVSKKESL